MTSTTVTDAAVCIVYVTAWWLFYGVAWVARHAWEAVSDD